MTKTNYYLIRALAVLVALAVAMSSLLEEARPAKAAFPGNNGKSVFASNRTTGEGVNNPEGDFEIFTMKPDGTGLTQLTFNSTGDYSPSFSADGRRVVFTSTRDGNPEIYSMSSEGLLQTRLTNNTTYEDYPTISPDGKIAYESLRGGNYEIIVLEAGVERNLSNSPADDFYPAFSPDGSKIAFTRYLGSGNSEVYVMYANGERPQNLSNNPAHDGEPDWSSNGEKIAFSSIRNGSYDIYVMDALDGSSQQRLTKNAAFDMQPAWSPDGTKIAFMSPRGGDDYEIYAMKATRPEGTKNRPKNLTKNDVVTDLAPHWQPLVT